MPRDIGVADGGFARVTTDYGQCTLKVVVSERQQRGMLFAPIHWSEATASAARVGALVAPFTDPFSGQPENKATPASIAPYEYVFLRFRAVADRPLELPPTRGGRASRSPAATAICSPTMPISRDGNPGCGPSLASDLAEYKDFGGGVFRAASFAGDRIETCLFIGPARDAGDWDVVKEPVRRRMRSATTSAGCCCRANPMDGLASAGPIVCACFGVGRTTICDAIAAGARTAAEIGAQAQGRHQLRLVHSRTEAADRAGGRGGDLRDAKQQVGWWPRVRSTRP